MTTILDLAAAIRAAHDACASPADFISRLQAIPGTSDLHAGQFHAYPELALAAHYLDQDPDAFNDYDDTDTSLWLSATCELAGESADFTEDTEPEIVGYQFAAATPQTHLYQGICGTYTSFGWALDTADEFDVSDSDNYAKEIADRDSVVNGEFN